jgi:hypothetical protein
MPFFAPPLPGPMPPIFWGPKGWKGFLGHIYSKILDFYVFHVEKYTENRFLECGSI